MYQKTVLPNGIRVLSEALPYVKSVSLGIWIATGSRMETLKNHGISHFIEHLMFKGTPSQSAKEIAEKVDAVGGQLNAFTAKEYTCYYMKVLDNHLEFSFQMLSDMLQNSLFASSEIDREREVILEEIHMYEDSPDELVHDIHLDALWASHALGRTILGTVDSVNHLNRDQIIKYCEEFYTPDNIVIAVAGNMNHQEVHQFAEKYFGNIKGTQSPANITRPEFIPAKLTRQKEIEQVHMCLSVPGIPQNSPDIYAAHILNNIFGGSASSRLFQSIREERGLAYSVYSFQANYSDAGLLSIYAGTRPINGTIVAELILQNMLDIKNNGVTAEELQKAKEQLKGSLLLGLESSSSRMSRLGKMELTLGRHLSLDDVVQKIDAVNLKQVVELADRLFVIDRLSFTALGPIEEDMFHAIKGV